MKAVFAMFALVVAAVAGEEPSGFAIDPTPPPGYVPSVTPYPENFVPESTSPTVTPSNPDYQQHRINKRFALLSYPQYRFGSYPYRYIYPGQSYYTSVDSLYPGQSYYTSVDSGFSPYRGLFYPRYSLY